MPLNAQQTQIARMLYQLGVQRGLTPQHAREFVSAGLAESTLRPRAVNKTSGAGGIFQLLSSGYRQRAQQLGGIFNPRANALAILPDYQRYWQQHPHAAPGEAGAGVERSGQGAGFYSRGLAQLGNLGGGPAGATRSPGALSAAPPPSGVSAAPDNLRKQLGMALLGAFQPGPAHGDFSPVYQLMQQRDQQGHTHELVPGVMVDHHHDIPKQAAPVIALAKSFQGTPYQWGGTTPKGFDCSGFVQYLYGHAGIQLPRTTYQQIHAGRAVDPRHLQPGDILFFGTPRDPHHEGLYIGHGQFIHAPHTGDHVRISALADYGLHLVAARRVH